MHTKFILLIAFSIISNFDKDLNLLKSNKSNDNNSANNKNTNKVNTKSSSKERKSKDSSKKIKDETTVHKYEPGFNIINITRVYELMLELKWDLDLHLKVPTKVVSYSTKKKNINSVIYRDSISITVTPNNIPEMQANFLKDLESCINKIVEEDLCRNKVNKKEKNYFVEDDENESDFIKTLRAVKELNPDEQVEVLKDYVHNLYRSFS